MTRATEDLLDSLHAMQGETLLGELRAFRNGERGEVDKEGVFHPYPVPSALLAQINKYLKDNGVDRAIKPGDPTSLLDEECPEFEDPKVISGRFK